MSSAAPLARVLFRGLITALLLAASQGQLSLRSCLAPSPLAASPQPPGSANSGEPARVLDLHQFLTEVSDRLVDVRSIELRRAESQAKLDHIRASRAFEVEVEGNYREEDVDRLEINGPNQKQGQSMDIRRQLTFSITRPLLGLSLEDRLNVATEEARVVELEVAETIARREALLDVIGIYIDLAAEQRHRELRQRAVELAEEMVRVQEARHERGESLKRDLLAAGAELARRRADLAASTRREVELQMELARRVDGEPPASFQAADLDWSQMIPAPGGTGWGGSPTVSEPSRPGWARGASVWYNLPQIDLTFFYRLESRDRDFIDERDRERGHTPGVELTLEFPLDVWRAGRSYSRQVAARAERRRLSLLELRRETEGRVREVEHAHAEAASRVAAAEAVVELREEEERVARLRAQGVAEAPVRSLELGAIEAELAVFEARIELAEARGRLARTYFERAMIGGADPMDLSSTLSPAPEVACRRPAGLSPRLSLLEMAETLGPNRKQE